jgi:glutamate/aspartate transport system substrate-binding protein
MTFRWMIALLTLLPLAAAAQSGAPEPTAGRLERIAATGQFVIGHRESSVPFAYFDQDQQPVGFGVDIALRVFEAVKAELKRPDLQLRFNAVTPATRLPLMETKVIDIECGATTNTVERQQQVAFSDTYYVDSVRIAVRQDSGISGFGDLAGKRVAVVEGTTIEDLVTRLAAEQKVGLTLALSRSERRAVQALEDGRADALVAAAALTLGEISRSADPSRYKVVGEELRREPYACVLPKDDPAFKRLVDRTLAGLMGSGEMERLRARWFEAPIPPWRRALNLPLNEATREAYASPNDRPLQ